MVLVIHTSATTKQLQQEISVPTIVNFDHSLPVLSSRLPLAAALLSSWEHVGCIMEVTAKVDAERMNRHRVQLGIVSAL